MMTANPVDADLGPRLERLTGEEASCCLKEFRLLARDVRRAPAFRTSLQRAHAMADASRLTALTMLRGRPEMCACEIQAALGVSHATVSHHMAVLAEAGLVRTERRGKWAYYRLNRDASVEIP